MLLAEASLFFYSDLLLLVLDEWKICYPVILHWLDKRLRIPRLEHGGSHIHCGVMGGHAMMGRRCTAEGESNFQKKPYILCGPIWKKCKIHSRR